jgi:hypothetical protein
MLTKIFSFPFMESVRQVQRLRMLQNKPQAPYYSPGSLVEQQERQWSRK